MWISTTTPRGGCLRCSASCTCGGSLVEILPSAVLFCCNMNAIRSPMAEGLMKRYHGARVYIDSAGITAAAVDPVMVEVMKEIGIDMSRHQPKPFSTLTDDSFDMVIALSDEARAQAERLT